MEEKGSKLILFYRFDFLYIEMFFLMKFPKHLIIYTFYLYKTFQRPVLNKLMTLYLPTGMLLLLRKSRLNININATLLITQLVAGRAAQEPTCNPRGCLRTAPNSHTSCHSL